MVVYNESRKITLGASESEKLIWKYVVPDGFKVTILETGFLIADDGHVDGYVDEVKIDDLEGKLYPDKDYRSVVNRELVAGQFWVFKATSVTAGDFGVLLVFDKVKL